MKRVRNSDGTGFVNRDNMKDTTIRKIFGAGGYVQIMPGPAHPRTCSGKMWHPEDIAGLLVRGTDLWHALNHGMHACMERGFISWMRDDEGNYYDCMGYPVDGPQYGGASALQKHSAQEYFGWMGARNKAVEMGLPKVEALKIADEIEYRILRDKYLNELWEFIHAHEGDWDTINTFYARMDREAAIIAEEMARKYLEEQEKETEGQKEKQGKELEKWKKLPPDIYPMLA